MKKFANLSLFLAIFASLFLIFSASAKSKYGKIPNVLHFKSPKGNVYFPHKKHIEDFEVVCVTCHHSRKAPNLKIPHSRFYDDYRTKYCKNCHEQDPKFKIAGKCSKCHLKRSLKLAKHELPSLRSALHRKCWECHDSGKGAEASKNCKWCHVKKKK